MSLKIGLVGLPNVGKSTLFKAITKKRVDIENYPFCTIEPNIGIVEVPDTRLENLAKISNSKRIVSAVIEFVDIAGLVKGAHEGKGLGNKFLSHIREVDAVIQVLRGFSDGNISHVERSVDIDRDKEIIDLELIISDIQLIEKVIEKLLKESKGKDKDKDKKVGALKKAKEILQKEEMLKDDFLSEEERDLIKEFNLLTRKPIIYLVNCDNLSKGGSSEYLYINAKIEEELAGIPKEEMNNYLSSFKMSESGLNKLIKESYRLLNLISFFTSEEKETRAWTVREGSKAPHAAGKIHSDFEKYFIRAEIIEYDDFINYGGWVNAKEKGKAKERGKDYIVKDGDVVFFKTGK